MNVALLEATQFSFDKFAHTCTVDINEHQRIRVYSMRGVAYDEGCGIGHACTHSSSSPFPPPAANAGGEPEEAGGLCAEAGSHEKRFVGHLVCSWRCAFQEYQSLRSLMKVCRGKEAKMVGEEAKMVGEEAKMVWGGDRDGVGRRQRWCGEEA